MAKNRSGRRGGARGPEPEGGQGPGTELEVKMRGSGDKVAQEGRRLFGGRDGGAAAPRPGTDGGAGLGQLDHVAALMKDPRNHIVVRRVQPIFWGDIKANVEVFRQECPTTIDDVKRFVFTEHGGHKFRVAVHDQEGTLVDAAVIENPETTDPIIEDARGEAPPGDVFGAPEEPKPLEVVQQQLTNEYKILTKRRELEQLREAIEDLRGGNGRGAPKADDAAVRALERRLDEIGRDLLRQEAAAAAAPRREPAADAEKEELKRRLAELERKLDQKSSEDKLVAVQSGMDARFNKMLEVIQGQQTNLLAQKLDAALERGGRGKADAGEDLDATIEKLVKLKNAFGQDASKAAKFEDMIFELAMTQLNGGKPAAAGGDPVDEVADDEDLLRSAFKHMMPVIKDWAKRELESKKQEGKAMTEEDARRIITEQANRAAREIASRMTRPAPAAALPPAPAPQPARPAAPAASRSPLDAQPGAPAPAAPRAAPAPAPPPPAAAPAPAAEAPYDRGRAVNLVLTTVLKEMESCPFDSFSVGDALDNWDPELLDEMMKVESGEDLQRALAPYADAALLDRIKRGAEADETRKRWLRRLITTLQDVWGQERSKPPEGPAGPAPAGEPPAERF